MNLKFPPEFKLPSEEEFQAMMKKHEAEGPRKSQVYKGVRLTGIGSRKFDCFEFDMAIKEMVGVEVGDLVVAGLPGGIDKAFPVLVARSDTVEVYVARDIRWTLIADIAQEIPFERSAWMKKPVPFPSADGAVVDCMPFTTEIQ